MTKAYESLTLEDAKRMLSAGEEMADSLHIPYNIAVVDAGGHLLAFTRQDDAMTGCIDLAIHKAVTARLFNRATSELQQFAQPGKPFYGIQNSNGGEVVILGGGIPVIQNGAIIGAIGASAGTAEQDFTVAAAAVAALELSPALDPS